MSSIEARIADVVADHMWVEHQMACFCGEGDTGNWDYSEAEHAGHVARILVEELGLTQEWAAGSTTPGESEYRIVGGSRGPSREAAAVMLYLPRFQLIRRYVTEWEADHE